MIEQGVKVYAIIADIPYVVHKNKFDRVMSFDEMWHCLVVVCLHMNWC